MHIYITRFIDFFYPPFKRFVSLQFFRYLFCGGTNVASDWILYFVFYNFVLDKNVVNLGITQVSPHIAAFLFTFPIILVLGFYLSSNVTFSGSELKGRIQLFRYLVIVFVNILINYVSLKLFVEVLRVYPTPSKMLTTVFTTIFSYFAQKHYSFKNNRV
ncbi:MAG: GtrA family protein [Breznakibacter sp.]